MTTFQHATVRPQALLSRCRLNGFSHHRSAAWLPKFVAYVPRPNRDSRYLSIGGRHATKCWIDGDDVSKPTYLLSRDQVM